MAANDNTQKLVWLYEAQNKDVLKKLNQIERQTKKNFSKSTKQVKSFNMTMQKGSSLAKTFATSLAGFGGLAIGAGLSGLASSIGSTTSGIVELASEAKRAGVSFEAFQELEYAAGKNKVSVDALTDGLKEMQLRADEFVTTGSGSGADAFARLGYSANELARRLKDPDQLFEDIIGRLQQLDRAAQIRVSDEIFGGTGGEQFVQMLGDGVEGLRKARKEARELGLVMSDDIVSKAQEIDQKFQQITATISTGMKSALVEVASEVSELINRFFELEDSIPDPGSRATSGAAGRRARRANRQALTFDEIFGGGGSSNYSSGAAGRRERRAARNPTSSNQPATNLVTNDPEETDSSVVPTIIPPSKPSGGRGTSSGQSDTNKIKERIAALQAEYDAIGQNATQQRVMNELRSSGADAASEQGQQMEALVLSIDKATKRQESMNYLSQQFENLGMNAFANVTNQIDTGNDALDTFLQTLAQASIQAAMFGSGPMAGLFGGGGGLFGFIGSMFGGFFADGGYLGAGKWGIAGENGPEPIKGPATVVPANKASGSQNTVVHVVPSDMFEIVMDRRAGAVVDSASGGIVSTAVGMANQTAPAAMAQHQLLTGGDWRNVG